MDAVDLLRLLLFSALVIAMGLMLTRIWQLYDVFDPAHWLDFVRKNFAGPLVTLVFVLLLWFFQEPIAWWILTEME